MKYKLYKFISIINGLLILSILNQYIIKKEGILKAQS